MKIVKKDLQARKIEDDGVQMLLVPDPEGGLRPQEVPIVTFGLSRYQVTLSLAKDKIKTSCPTKPMTGCNQAIEFDAGELEKAFKESEAYQTACPECQRPLGLILSKDLKKSFFFGWLP